MISWRYLDFQCELQPRFERETVHFPAYVRRETDRQFEHLNNSENGSWPRLLYATTLIYHPPAPAPAGYPYNYYYYYQTYHLPPSHSSSITHIGSIGGDAKSILCQVITNSQPWISTLIHPKSLRHVRAATYHRLPPPLSCSLLFRFYSW